MLFKWFFKEYHHVWCEQRDKLAAKDPKWAEIQARRNIGCAHSSLWMSEERNLGLAEWEYQNSVENACLPHTWAHKLHWFMENHGLSSQQSRIKHAYQRVHRGYDDSAWWNLHYYLADYLPPLLEQLAEHHHGVPMDYVQRTNENTDEASKLWTDELKDTAAKIRNANNKDCSHDNGRCIKDVHCYIAEDDLKQAMAWLGEHWFSLWD